MVLSEQAQEALEQALEAAQVVQAPGVTMEDRALAHKAYEHFMERYLWYKEEDKQLCAEEKEHDEPLSC
jgi:hypothetical protein